MSPLQIQWDRIRRRWVLILVIGLVAAAGSLGASLLQGTTYTGRAALTIVSQDRAPEQDTVLAQGYADYFNQPSSQEVLRQSAGVPQSATLNARIAAASPIVYIEATASTPDVAADASTKMAIALRDDVNQGLQGDSARQIQDLQRQLAQAQATNNTSQVSQLQDQISTLQSDTNQLQDLQLNAGVAANSASAGRNAGAALLGGLLFGALLAMALGRFENRILTPSEVRDRLDLPVLAMIGGKRRSGEDSRSQLLRSLMGLTNPHGMPSPGALAVTGPYTTRASKSRVAVALAGLRALQGQTTLLVQTDLEADPLPSELSSMSGVADFLAERGGSRVDGKVFSNGRALLVAPPGSKRDDLFALFSKSHVQRLLSQGSALADLVVIDAPPVESVEGQVVCSAADRSLLVIEEGETRTRDAAAALDALGRAGATALGVVLVRNPGQMNDPGFLADHNWTPVRLPTAPPSARPGPPMPAAPPATTSGPAGSSSPGQVPPADRTQPISAKRLEEAREALARDPGNAAGVVAGAAVGASGGTNGRPAKGANGTPLDTAGPPSSRREDKPAVDGPAGAKPVSPGKPDGATESTPGSGGKPAPDSPARGAVGGSPAARGPGSTAQPERNAASRSTPDARGGAPPRPAPPGPARTGGPSEASAAAPGSPPAARTSGPPASGPAGNAPSPGGKTPSPGGKAPAPGGPAMPEATPGPEARVTRRVSGSDAKPSPRPKPGDPPPARGPSSTAAPTPAMLPGSPEGAKRVGTAHFTSGSSATAATGSSDKAGKPEGDQGKARDGLSAPTVTMRTEK